MAALGGAEGQGEAEQVVLLAPGRCFANPVIEVLVEALQFALEGLEESGDTLLELGVGEGLLPLRLGHDHAHDLLAVSEHFAEQASCLVRQGTQLGTGGFSEVGDNGGIDGISLGPLAKGLGEGAYLGQLRVDRARTPGPGSTVCRRNDWNHRVFAQRI
jgi:hypothetical protein